MRTTAPQTRLPMFLLPMFLLLALVACDGKENLQENPPLPGLCTAANDHFGYTTCLSSVPDRAAWQMISLEGSVVDQVRTSKYLVPARSDARLATVFINVNAFVYHLEFLVTVFPDLFAELTSGIYADLIFDPLEREFYAGTVTEYAVGGRVALYGYTIWEDTRYPDGALTCAQAEAVHREMGARFTLAPVALVPTTGDQVETLSNCSVPLYDANSAVKYEAYNPGVGYGYIRRHTAAEFREAQAKLEFDWRNILVLDEAPFDIETVIAGAVTGTRQGELSHLNIRSAARGTPNCFAASALAVFADWDDQLVRLQCGTEGWTIEAATVTEAEQWWAQLKPTPILLAEPDVSWTAFAGLLDLPIGTAADRQLAGRRYGAKGKNLATLYQLEPLADAPQHRLKGFLIPFAFYRHFIETHGWTVDLGAGPVDATFAETIDAFLADPTFRADGRVRREKLAALRTAMRSSAVDPILLEQIAEAIRGDYGGDTQMVRFRSSSNAEDALLFTGAGLYSSTSACLADELDGDDTGPSRCDPDQPAERSVRRALTKVWSSLFAMKAFEEREWYGIDHTAAAMGILVNTRTKNERANAVAFTHDPFSDSDDRYLVNAQIGELDVVSADPGVFPEKVLLGLEGNTVSHIDRLRESSELTPGEVVLTDQQLGELGRVLRQIEVVYPIDNPTPSDEMIALDTEWKVTGDGQLIIKQIRPFLK